jgi:hypothetical protein
MLVYHQEIIFKKKNIKFPYDPKITMMQSGSDLIVFLYMFACTCSIPWHDARQLNILTKWVLIPQDLVVFSLIGQLVI